MNDARRIACSWSAAVLLAACGGSGDQANASDDTQGATQGATSSATAGNSAGPSGPDATDGTGGDTGNSTADSETGSDTGPAPGDLGLYETFELELTGPADAADPFTIFGTVTFSDGTQDFVMDAFYDGGSTWRARFMPDATGPWTYTWVLEGDTGDGTFDVGPSSLHGHVSRDPRSPQYLRYQDGAAHHWIGGKWFSGQHYGPPDKDGVPNESYRDDATFTAYLDELADTQHNGVLLKTALFPLLDDGLAWDLDWLHRGEWLVQEAAARGIYVQVNFFDTWSRGPGTPFEFQTDGGQQIFNVWASGDDDRKRNYIRTIVARYSSYFNVYWELGNEMERSNSGAGFVDLSNQSYIPWIHEFDAYDLPIGLSEGIWESADVDIGFLHQATSLPNGSRDRPTVMNELVAGGITGSLWEDATIRNADNRIAYRRTFWRMFTRGGSGSSEATWLQLDEALSEAVLDVMADHGRLAQFLDELPCHLNDMDPVDAVAGPGDTSTRAQAGQCYVAYLLLGPGESAAAGSVELSADPGTYDAQWVDPSSGAVVSTEAVNVVADPVSVPYPAFTEDLVLRVTNVAK